MENLISPTRLTRPDCSERDKKLQSEVGTWRGKNYRSKIVLSSQLKTNFIHFIEKTFPSTAAAAGLRFFCGKIFSREVMTNLCKIK